MSDAQQFLAIMLPLITILVLLGFIYKTPRPKKRLKRRKMKSISEIIDELKPLLEMNSVGLAVKKAGISQNAHTALLKHDEYKTLIEKFRIKNSSFASVTIEKLEREKAVKYTYENKQLKRWEQK